MPTGGTPDFISLNGRSYSIASAANPERILGGKVNTFESNSDGTGRLIKSAQGWKLSDYQISIDDLKEDQEYIDSLAALNDFFTVVVGYPSGVVYQGRGQITGDHAATTNSTITLTLEGPGELTKQ